MNRQNRKLGLIDLMCTGAGAWAAILMALGAQDAVAEHFGDGEEGPTQSQCGIGPSCFTQRFAHDTTLPQVLDLLFVLDTANTTRAQRTLMATEIDAFAESLPPGLDYQIAVVLAHGSRSPYFGRLYHDWDERGVLSIRRMSRELMRSTLIDYFTNAPSDTWGEGGREGLYSLYRALDPDRILDIRGQGFFRRNAMLGVIFVSNESDVCADQPAGTTALPDPSGQWAAAKNRDCWGVHPESVYERILDLQGALPVFLGGMLYGNPQTIPHCKGSQCVKGTAPEYGYGYLDLIQLGGGFYVDFAASDLTVDLSALGKEIADRLTVNPDSGNNFELSNGPVDPNSISVRVMEADDIRHPHGDGHCRDDWYDWDDWRHRDHFWDWDSHGCRRSHPRPVCFEKMPIDRDPLGYGRWADFSYDSSTQSVRVNETCGNHEKIVEVHYCVIGTSPSPSPTPSPTPSSAPSSKPSSTPTPSPSASASPSPSPSPSATPSPSPSVSSTPSPTPTATASPSPTPTVSASPTPSPTVSSSPSPTPTATASPTPSPTVSASPSPTPTVSASPTPSPTVSASPSPTPTASTSPSPTPTATASPSPTSTASATPSPSPSTCSGPFCGGGAVGN